MTFVVHALSYIIAQPHVENSHSLSKRVMRDMAPVLSGPAICGDYCHMTTLHDRLQAASLTACSYLFCILSPIYSQNRSARKQHANWPWGTCPRNQHGVVLFLSRRLRQHEADVGFRNQLIAQLTYSPQMVKTGRGNLRGERGVGA